MKNSVLIFFVVIMGCGGSLSDEQRKRIREDMASHQIKRVTEVEITEAAYTKGRSFMKLIETLGSDTVKIDSFLRAHEGQVRLIIPGQANALEIEKQLVEAYLSTEAGNAQDNIQKIRTDSGIESDSLLYTKPVITTLPNGTERLDGVWNVWLSKKEIVLSMNK